jgi:hypothetical protein
MMEILLSTFKGIVSWKFFKYFFLYHSKAWKFLLHFYSFIKITLISYRIFPYLMFRCVIGTARKIYTACTIDERFERASQPLKGISIKNIYAPELSYPTTKKIYINLKGLPNKKCSCMRCHWYRMHDFCVRKSIISRRILCRIQKGFSPWIRGPGGIVWWKKNRRSKSQHCYWIELRSWIR